MISGSVILKAEIGVNLAMHAPVLLDVEHYSEKKGNEIQARNAEINNE